MSSMNDNILSALMELGADDLFNRIYETITSYYDALVWYNPETQQIDVEPVPNGNYPHPDEQRILIHREQVWNSCDDGLDGKDPHADGDISLFMSNKKNNSESINTRVKDSRRHNFLESWLETIHEWAEKAAQNYEDAWKDKMIEDSLRKDFEAMMADDKS